VPNASERPAESEALGGLGHWEGRKARLQKKSWVALKTVNGNTTANECTNGLGTGGRQFRIGRPLVAVACRSIGVNSLRVDIVCAVHFMPHLHMHNCILHNLKLWRNIKNPAPSINEEHISSNSEMSRRIFLQRVASVRRTRKTARWRFKSD